MSGTEENSGDESGVNFPVFERPQPDPEVFKKVESITTKDAELGKYRLILEKHKESAMKNPNVATYLLVEQQSRKYLIDAEVEIKLLKLEDKLNSDLSLAYAKIAEACQTQKTLKDTYQMLSELLNTYWAALSINSSCTWKLKDPAPRAKNTCTLLLEKMEGKIESLKKLKPYFDPYNDDFQRAHDEATTLHNELLIKLPDIKNEIGRSINEEGVRNFLLREVAVFEELLTKWFETIPNKLQR